jgi:hypothetical protein
VEAGQVARQSIDELADLLYTTDAQASETLASEGIAAERVHCVGNLLVDALQIASQIQPGAAADRERLSVAAPYLVNRSGYGLVVINQPLNIDSRQSLQDCLAVLHDVSRDLQLVWPMHRVTEARLKRFQLYESLVEDRITCLPPQPYADYVALLRAATCVLTDSWSVQEEATALGIPCITLGRHPERAITVTVGSNIPVGSNHAFAARVVWECIFNGGKRIVGRQDSGPHCELSARLVVLQHRASAGCRGGFTYSRGRVGAVFKQPEKSFEWSLSSTPGAASGAAWFEPANAPSGEGFPVWGRCVDCGTPSGKSAFLRGSYTLTVVRGSPSGQLSKGVGDVEIV